GPSGPNSVQTPNPPAKRSNCRSSVLTQTLGLNAMSNVPPMSSQRRTNAFELGSGHHAVQRTTQRQMLLRKEVIQPHLPVRLPCYDLVLITNPTFDGSLHKG